ncbi:tyrosine-type recombinase/integrase [Trueperella sp. zg.1013]|nr:tyrosine-type recombinase/integrase [Trueperella sp. zg.1013]
MIESVFKKAISESGVQKIRVHDLRHSHATWLISEGINIVAVSKRLGHATIEQTLKTYTHLSRNSEEQLIKKINEYNNEYKN